MSESESVVLFIKFLLLEQNILFSVIRISNAAFFEGQLLKGSICANLLIWAEIFGNVSGSKAVKFHALGLKYGLFQHFRRFVTVFRHCVRWKFSSRKLAENFTPGALPNSLHPKMGWFPVFPILDWAPDNRAVSNNCF